jgi:hypothetical protein
MPRHFRADPCPVSVACGRLVLLRPLRSRVEDPECLVPVQCCPGLRLGSLNTGPELACGCRGCLLPDLASRFNLPC